MENVKLLFGWIEGGGVVGGGEAGENRRLERPGFNSLRDPFTFPSIPSPLPPPSAPSPSNSHFPEQLWELSVNPK